MNTMVRFSKSLINIQIEFIFGKILELLRIYEKFFRDFHRGLPWVVS
jgi:hypothetical protein